MPKYQIAEHVKCVSTPDGGVLLDRERGTYYSTNPVASRIVQQIEAGLRTEEIVQRLQETFDVPAERLESDVNRFIESLQAKGMCSPCPDSSDRP